MTYKCLECGQVFKDSEIAHWTEDRGEFWGTPCKEIMSGCPVCGSNFEETQKCEICGGEHLEDELTGGVCEECINKYRGDFDMCYRISLGDVETIKINSLLASLFDSSDIEQILIEHIKNKWEDVDCSKYIDYDSYWFGEELAKKVKNDECEKRQ